MSLDKIFVIGDRILIKPKTHSDKTSSGLFLPPNIKEKEKIQSGYVIKIGPGYPIPNHEETESWQAEQDILKYIPLQVEEGDLAIFLLRNAYEIEYEKQKYFIVPQSAVLMVERDF